MRKANAIQTVNFHGHELPLVAYNDEPHVAMKPVAEAIGLQWQAQYNRIRRHPVLATCVSVMDMQLPGDTQRRAVVILPLQYLNGWLFGIDASRVKPAIRERLVQYQRECFQALYDYWAKGVAINPRTTISPEQQRTLQELVAARAREVPEGFRRRAYPLLWGALKSKFRVGTYKDLPAAKFEEARSFLAEVALEGELLAAPRAGERLDLHYPIRWWAERNPGHVTLDPESETLSVELTDLVCARHSPCLDLLEKLHHAGYDVEGAFYELRAYQNLLPRLRDTLLNTAYMAQQLTQRLTKDLHMEQSFSVRYSQQKSLAA